MRRSILVGSTSTQSATPSFIVTASGCAPPIPPSPAVSEIVPASVPPNRFAAIADERLVRALQDALRADVDPRARRHLAVHRQTHRLEAAELLPGRPLGHEVGVRDQHARGPLVGLDDADRLARLHEQRLVALELPQLADDRVERRPRACRATGAAVDDQVVGPLGDLGIEVVHQHPHGGFLLPALAGQARCRAARAPRAVPTSWTSRSPPGGRPGRSQRQPTAPVRPRLTDGRPTATIGA